MGGFGVARLSRNWSEVMAAADAWTEGEDVLMERVAATDTWMFICIHSTQLGPAAGGTRLRVYGRPLEGLLDGIRLAEAMTLKCAAAGLPFGGGKAVLAVPRVPGAEERALILHRYADMVQSLGGRFVTGPDMNTSSTDIDVIAERGARAYGRSESRGGWGSSGPATAVGVFHGIRASVSYVFGSSDLQGRRVLVQGVGGVGGPLAELLSRAGARVLVNDVERPRAQALAGRIAAVEIDPDAALTTPCDVLAPCAVGGILNERSILHLHCRIVAGAANNQLETPADAKRLAEAGILYAPDFVINAGGAIFLAGGEAMGWSKAEVEERLRGIGDTLTAIYRSAAAAAITTAEAAERFARERLRRPTGLVREPVTV